jgi:hypothetical protein
VVVGEVERQLPKRAMTATAASVQRETFSVRIVLSILGFYSFAAAKIAIWREKANLKKRKMKETAKKRKIREEKCL